MRNRGRSLYVRTPTMLAVSSQEADAIHAALAILGTRLGEAPEAAAVFGSGWKELAGDLLTADEALPLAEVPSWPRPKVQGHGGELRVGELTGGGRRVVFCTGRVHAYEGFEARELVRGVRVLAAWGVPRILLLNAAGSLEEEREPGSLMPFADHLNLGLPNPLQADQTEDGIPVFLDLVDLYDPAWRRALAAACPELRPGVYAGLPGPSYETPAEVARLRKVGAHAVGMSTVPEAIAARAAGAHVMAISLITNWAAGLRDSRPSHGEVLETARDNAAAAARVLAAALAAAP